MNDNKKIAVNSLFLYAKLIITIIVNFIVSRVVLDALGASDYGLYNVVGGIVAMLNTLGTTMVSTSYRYMSVEIGKGEQGDPNKVYNTVFVIHLLLALILLLLGETLGVFYVNNYLNVDPSKIPDALFVLHLSLVTTAIAVITVPMNGLIIAREKFLFTSVIESISVLLQLLFVFLLLSVDGNRLRWYAFFLAVVHLIVPIAYQCYCRVKDAAIVKWRFNRDISDYKDVSVFAFWILIGAIAHIAKNQGVAVVLNFFFGTLLNAAYGLALQVSHAATRFTSSLRQAAVPQIMKSQAAGNNSRALTLVYAMSRYSYLCMNVMAIPLLFNMDFILIMWLNNPPNFTLVFVNYMLISGMIANLGAGFEASIQATGRIRKNQIGVSIINISIIPIIYILYKLGFPPYANVITSVVLSVLTLIYHIIIMEELTDFTLIEYIHKTLKPSLLSTLFAIVPLMAVKAFIPGSIFYQFLFILFSFIWTIVSIIIIGLTAQERILLNKVTKKIFH